MHFQLRREVGTVKAKREVFPIFMMIFMFITGVPLVCALGYVWSLDAPSADHRQTTTETEKQGTLEGGSRVVRCDPLWERCSSPRHVDRSCMANVMNDPKAMEDVRYVSHQHDVPELDLIVTWCDETQRLYGSSFGKQSRHFK